MIFLNSTFCSLTSTISTYSLYMQLRVRDENAFRNVIETLF